MNRLSTSYIVDFCILLVFVVAVIRGYRQGFFARLYDFISTILVFILSFILSGTLSEKVALYKGEANLISSFTTPVINRIVWFFILLLILFILKKIIGGVLKPFFKKLGEKFTITKVTSGIIGAALSFVKTFVLAYLVLTSLFTFSSYKDVLNNTMLAKGIVEIYPLYRQDFEGYVRHLVEKNTHSFIDQYKK